MLFAVSGREPTLGEVVIVHTAEPIQGETDHVGLVTKVFDGRTIAAFVMPAFSGPLMMVGIHRRGVVNVIGTPSWSYRSEEPRSEPGQGDGLDAGDYVAVNRVLMVDSDDNSDEET